MEAVPAYKKFTIISELAGCYGSIQNNYVRSQACFEAANTSGSNDRNTSHKRQLINKIKECHEEVKGICGYRRVQVWLKRKYHINYQRVQRSMKEMGIRAAIRKKRPYYGKKEP